MTQSDDALVSDPTRPGPLYLALLAAPGLVFWLGFAGALALKPSTPPAWVAILPVAGLFGLAAGIPALGCRGSARLRWTVCLLDCAPLIVLVYLAANLRFDFGW